MIKLESILTYRKVDFDIESLINDSINSEIVKYINFNFSIGANLAIFCFTIKIDINNKNSSNIDVIF